MAYDKVVDSSVLDAGLKQIADSIREKGGTSGDLEFPAAMAEAIADIQTGAPINNQDKTFTENGTYTADNGYTGLGTVTVNVASSGGGDDMFELRLNGALSTYSDPDRTSIAAGAFSGCTTLSSVNMPALKEIGEDGFRKCTGLTSVTFPNLETVGSSAFYMCSNLESIAAPKLTNGNTYLFYACASLQNVGFPLLKNLGNYSFYQCALLKSVFFPALTSIDGPYAFRGCTELETVDLGFANSIPNGTFYDCAKLKNIILRKTGSVCTLENTGAFDGTMFAAGKASDTVGTLYVPQSMVNRYTSATNWSNCYARNKFNVVSLEGSEFE